MIVYADLLALLDVSICSLFNSLIERSPCNLFNIEMRVVSI